MKKFSFGSSLPSESFLFTERMFLDVIVITRICNGGVEMKNFDKIIQNGFIHSEKENDCLFPTGHVPDCHNGAFVKGKLAVIVTTEHVDDMIIECVSISRDGFRKPNTEEIEMVKNLFWRADEIGEINRLYVSSNVIHLARKVVNSTIYH